MIDVEGVIGYSDYLNSGHYQSRRPERNSHPTSAAACDLGELVLSSGDTAAEAFDLTEPVLAFGPGNASLGLECPAGVPDRVVCVPDWTWP